MLSSVMSQAVSNVSAHIALATFSVKWEEEGSDLLLIMELWKPRKSLQFFTFPQYVFLLVNAECFVMYSEVNQLKPNANLPRP